MKHSARIFQVVRDQEALVVIPARAAAEPDRAQFAAEVTAMLRLLESKQARHVVVDFRGKSYFGCTEFAFFFLQLWTAANKHGGQMAFCGLSNHEREVLQVAKLDNLWPICATREKALAAVRERKPEPARQAAPQIPELFA